jgi:DNA mismatch repair protein MutS
MVDVLCCLAKAARDLRFTRPLIAEDSVLRISGGRHPVVESITEEGAYIANDVHLDARDRQILLITGPNMAGKSTYLRQVGLIALLAQIGSFVPADKAHIGLVDRIFTRVGATDRLAKGQSTFMVEMIETANILNHATPRSLILLDEIGRGTSTYDGLSLAWAIAERLHQDPRIAARTLFATHYHELTRLARDLPRLRNVQVTVKEADGRVIFLRKVIEGGCDSSYGIHVAKMAGVPDPVIGRAWEILAELEGQGTAGIGGGASPGTGQGRAAANAPAAGIAAGNAPAADAPLREAEAGYPAAEAAAPRKAAKGPSQVQVDLFQPALVEIENPLHRKAYEEVLRLDLDHMSPVQLMLKLHELKARLSEAAETQRPGIPAAARPG